MTPYHSMEIYEDDESIAEVVAALFIQTRQLDQPCLLIARPAINDMVKARLKMSHIDMHDITILSSEDMLVELMDGTFANPVKFRERIGGLLTGLCIGRQVCIVTIYADMADVLIHRDNPNAAISLEVLWNQMAREYAFTLACGYSADDMRTRIPTIADLERLCLEHNRVNTMRHQS